MYTGAVSFFNLSEEDNTMSKFVFDTAAAAAIASDQAIVDEQLKSKKDANAAANEEINGAKVRQYAEFMAAGRAHRSKTP